MWDERQGFFFDYDLSQKKKSDFFSLAGYYPLWAGLATPAQATKLIKNLNKFETAYGLANTSKTNLSKKFKQWDYPNGWPNQQWITIKGLSNYGYQEEALRLATRACWKKW